MSVHTLVWVLLAVAMAAGVLSAAGVLLARNAYDRLHYLAPVASVGAVAVGAAMLLEQSVSPAGIKAILAVLVVLVMNPILTHATARAARVRQLGQWEPRPDEDIPSAEERRP